MIVAEKTRLFRHITNRNLLWQYDFLMDSIRIGLADRLKLNGYIIGALNFLAVVNLCDEPGKVRSEDVHIENSPHEPPGHDSVNKQYLDFIVELHHEIWPKNEPLYVAAYVLWKISWIHPFVERNGRTARAAMYYALSIKMGKMLKGADPITAQMRKQPSLYYEQLQKVDRSYEQKGKPDLSDLVDYLDKLLEQQLASSSRSR